MPHEVLDLKRIRHDTEQESINPQRIKEESQSAPLLSWNALEYTETPKRLEWFLVLAVITVTLVITALFLRNYFFALFIAIAGGLIAWFGKRPPRNVRYAVTGEGIVIDHRFLSFKDLKSYWIFYDPPLFNELSVESGRMFMPRIIIPLGATPPEEVRAVLRRFLPENKQEESLITVISRALRF